MSKRRPKNDRLLNESKQSEAQKIDSFGEYIIETMGADFLIKFIGAGEIDTTNPLAMQFLDHFRNGHNQAAIFDAFPDEVWEYMIDGAEKMKKHDPTITGNIFDFFKAFCQGQPANMRRFPAFKSFAVMYAAIGVAFSCHDIWIEQNKKSEGKSE